MKSGLRYPTSTGSGNLKPVRRGSRRPAILPSVVSESTVPMKPNLGCPAVRSSVVPRPPRRLFAMMVGLVVVATAASACTSASATAHRASTPNGAAGGAGVAPTPTSPVHAYDPPATTMRSAPARIYDVGHDVSDPFLTVGKGRYDLILSEGGAGVTMNVPVVSGIAVGQWGAITDVMPTLPPWAAPGFTWAPDLHRFGSTFVLYFTALVKSTSPAMECIGAATGSSPTGPFIPMAKPYICQVSQGGSIDPRVFTDDNGTMWMIWKSDQNIGGSSTPTMIWSAPLTGDGMAFTAKPKAILQPDEPWQGTIVESPDMVKVLGTYWLFYSGNWFNSPDYAIGAARCAGPMGPCADSSSVPLVASNAQGKGPGEESVYSDPTGAWLLYTPWHSDSPNLDIPPRPVAMTRIGFGPTGPYLATWMDPPSPPPSMAESPSSSGPTSAGRFAPPTS